VLAVHAWTVGQMADFAWQSRRILRRESVSLPKAAIRDVVRLGAEVELGWSSVEGEAATVLLDAARNAELLVLAAHDGTAPAYRPLGSVAERCVREAGMPVVIVPAPVLRHHEWTDVPTGEWLSSVTRTA
jgi:nucleotide-binding universal stress UspA family protein